MIGNILKQLVFFFGFGFLCFITFQLSLLLMSFASSCKDAVGFVLCFNILITFPIIGFIIDLIIMSLLLKKLGYKKLWFVLLPFIYSGIYIGLGSGFYYTIAWLMKSGF
jgi:hypothetical protein